MRGDGTTKSCAAQHIAVVPLKRLAEAKGRLAAVLPPLQRRELMIALVERTVNVLRACGVIDTIAMATEEIDLAMQLDTVHLPDRGSLNSTLRHAAAWSATEGAHALLILPADLPWVDGADIRALVGEANDDRLVRLAPANGGGTGALFLSPPQIIAPGFGPGSFARHRAAAADAGVRLEVVRRHGLAFDLDTVEDLHILQTRGTRASSR